MGKFRNLAQKSPAVDGLLENTYIPLDLSSGSNALCVHQMSMHWHPLRATEIVEAFDWCDSWDQSLDEALRRRTLASLRSNIRSVSSVSCFQTNRFEPDLRMSWKRTSRHSIGISTLLEVTNVLASEVIKLVVAQFYFSLMSRTLMRFILSSSERPFSLAEGGFFKFIWCRAGFEPVSSSETTRPTRMCIHLSASFAGHSSLSSVNSLFS